MRVRSFLGKIDASAEHIVVGRIVDVEGCLLVSVYLLGRVISGTMEEHHFWNVGPFRYFFEVELLLHVHFPNEPVLDSFERFNRSNFELLCDSNKLITVWVDIMY